MSVEKSSPISQAPGVSLFIGTKAQFIKMIPIAWELEARRIPYRIVNTGQHGSITRDLREQYRVAQPEIALGKGQRDVGTLGGGVLWAGSNLVRYAGPARRTRRWLFDDRAGVALVHGDTASTLLSASIARRGGQKVMHIEAGLRSWRLLNPFPEELVRILVMRMSHYLIAPSAQAHENLSAMSLAGRCWRVSGNTGLDVVSADLAKGTEVAQVASDPYCVVTIHRMETLYNRSRLEAVVNGVLQAQSRVQVLFVQHAPTARRLAAYGMLERLRAAGVEMLDLMDHAGFVHLLKDAEFIVTDGGSVQEEAGYLGVPCLLMRLATERPDGLEANVVLSEMDPGRIGAFMDDYQRYRRAAVDFDAVRPSAEIVDILESVVGLTPDLQGEGRR